MKPYGTLGRDLGLKETAEHECELCAAHDRANVVLPKSLLCPNCDRELDLLFSNWQPSIVSETNGEPETQRYMRLPMLECECGAHIALMPHAITYNANHDVYYTGSGTYLPHIDEAKALERDLQHAMMPSIEQYLSRYQNEPNLTPDYLALWIARSIAHVIAAFLKKIGVTP